jgi:heptosyltransferase-3
MIRRRKYDFCINLIGDVRENIIGAMTGAKWNIAPVWSRGHLFKRKMTDLGAGLIPNCGISIPPTNASFYKSMDYFAAQLGLAGLEWRSTATRRTELRYGVTVAIHPGASHASRHWPDERWRDLMRQLRILGYNVKVVGAHHERKELLSVFRNESSDPGVTFVTEEVPGLISSIEDVDVLIGMDSFSVHAAHALGVPVVVLNGSSDPSILTPPGGMVTSAGHMCKHYPCYYKLPCKGTESEYICVRGIEVSSVMSALNVIVARGKRV